MSRTWFITGAGRGFGREFATAALQRGDRVAATARDGHALDDLLDRHPDALLPLTLDVTDRDAVLEAVGRAHDRFGRIDVVVNNAGFGLFGAVEEIAPDQLRRQLEVNLLGPLHVVQAVLPVLREQGGGHIVQISSISGVVALPDLGGYTASKFALEGLSESLAQEVERFGVAVTIVEPGGYATDWSGSSADRAERLPEYDRLHEAVAERMRQNADRPGFVGDPRAVGPALLRIVDAERPPLRVFFGDAPAARVPEVYRQRLETWRQWGWLAAQANG